MEELPEDKAALEGPPMKGPAQEEPDLVENSAAPLTRPRKLTGWRCW
jgi:hypothetical protein